ncbi:hypothetical protein C900_05381 [Fulvivirga imtechensis AK7]|uniref:Integrase catalytic domain-containing protein n=1 Tax=Fulvivirga imtechensis AK7 TaxID=1237149 RepID=L8JK47_9BACT|nr:DDE-type integrase/transposase/recombinase [Fulvivirga imtechensis]ELR69185.1 hypothetical protein C900_05381 [Fulvivirga imtechensis AK7]
MVVKNNIVWLSTRELVEQVPAEFQAALEETINKGKYRNRNNGLESWHHEKVNGEVLINYNTIPEPTLAKYDLPDPAKLMKRNIEQLFTTPAKAYDYFLANPDVYEVARELSETAGWLLYMASVSRSHAAAMGYSSLDHLYEDAKDLMAAKDWSKWKCNSIQVFKRKLKPFNKLFKKPLNGNYSDQDLYTALDSLISKKYGNNNSQKLGEEQEALLVQIYSEPNAKPSLEQTYQMYLRTANEMVQAYTASNGQHGWSHKAIVSYSTVKHFLMSKEVQQIVYANRHGKQAYRSKYEMVTHREIASFANAMWVMDGTPVHRYYYDPESKGNYARLNVFVIIDAHSWCVLGFFVSYKETSKAVKGALRSACNLSGYVPHQIQFDNSSAIKSFDAQQCLAALSPSLTPAAVGNSRSKVIEPWFKHFNEQVLKFRTGFTGSPVMGSKIDSKPNPEYIAHLVKTKQIVPINKAIKEIHEDFTIWNYHVMKKYGKSPLDRYKASIESSIDKQRPYTPQLELEAFFEMPGDLKTVKLVEQGKSVNRKIFIPQPYEYTTKGIMPTINNEKMIFSVDSPEFNSRYLGEKFNIKYDPAAPERVYLYKDNDPVRLNGEHVVASKPERFHQALVDRTEGEGRRLHDHLKTKDKQKELAENRFTRYVDLTIQNGTYTKAVTENAFDKEVLNAARAHMLEQIVNGDDFRLDQPHDSEHQTKDLSRFLYSNTPNAKPGNNKNLKRF